MECLASPPINPRLSPGRLSSGYGGRIGHTTGLPSFHAGNDFISPYGAPVYAVRRGTVEHVLRNEPVTSGFTGYGNAVVIRHERDGVWTLYAHLARTHVARGQAVAAGDVIGAVGRTNNGKFPGMPHHLHFETRFARADGSSPFPGPYGSFNMDPQVFLREVEVGCNWRGVFSLGRDACRPWSSTRLRGLAGLGQAPEDGGAAPGPDPDMEGYEPPVEDWWYLITGSNWALGAIIGGGILTAAGAAALADYDRRRRRR